MSNQANNPAQDKAQSAGISDEDQVVDYLISNPDFFLRHSTLLNDLQVPHEAGGAVSLIERQVTVLREKNEHFQNKLREMVDAVHDNQRLHVSLHRLSVSLLEADGIDDMIGIVDDELRHKLGTDFVYFRLHSESALTVDESQSHTYISSDDPLLELFAPVLKKQRIHCGRLSEAQLEKLFLEDALEVRSAAVIPVEVPGIRGIIGLGSRDEHRYHPGMGTDFLGRLAELITAAMRAQLARR